MLTEFADSVAVIAGAHGAIGAEVGAPKSLISDVNEEDERLFRNVVALAKPHPVVRPDAVKSIAASPNVFGISVRPAWLSSTLAVLTADSATTVLSGCQEPFQVRSPIVGVPLPPKS